MFTYGEPLSEKSNLELEALLYLRENLERLNKSTLDCSSYHILAREIMDSDFINRSLFDPFNIKLGNISFSDPWIYYHWEELAALDFALSDEFEDLISEPKFAQEWYNPIADPHSYKLFVYEQTLSCLLSAPELEFLFNDKSGKLEVTDAVCTKVMCLQEENPARLEQLLRSPRAIDRLEAESVCKTCICEVHEYPINPKMSELDRFLVLFLGDIKRLDCVISEWEKPYKPDTYALGNKLDIYSYFDSGEDLLSAAAFTCLHWNGDPHHADIAFANCALNFSSVLELVKDLPKEDISCLTLRTPQLKEKLSEHTLDHSSNSLSDLTQEAKTASHALSSNDRNIDVKEHEER